MNHPMPEALCLRFHRAHLHLRFLCVGMSMLRCDRCETFR